MKLVTETIWDWTLKSKTISLVRDITCSYGNRGWKQSNSLTGLKYATSQQETAKSRWIKCQTRPVNVMLGCVWKFPSKWVCTFRLSIFFQNGHALSDMVLGKVKCPEKREELIKELNKLKSELAQLQVTKVIKLAYPLVSPPVVFCCSFSTTKKLVHFSSNPSNKGLDLI